MGEANPGAPKTTARRGASGALLDPGGGMLEHANLLLQTPDPSSVQAVVEPSTAAPLGFARPRPHGLLRRWLWGVLLEVHEHEDASLLCTVHRSWLRPSCRVVYDADGRHVGAVRGRRLEDRNGRIVAVRRPDADRQGEIFHDPEGRPLASLQPGKEGLSVAFTETATDPFARMLVLAAALT